MENEKEVSVQILGITDRLIKAAEGGRLNSEAVERELLPFVTKMEASSAMAKSAAQSLHKLIGTESDWRFYLADDVVAKVQFSNRVNKSHLRAFVTVFTAMAEAYVEHSAEIAREEAAHEPANRND